MNFKSKASKNSFTGITKERSPSNLTSKQGRSRPTSLTEKSKTKLLGINYCLTLESWRWLEIVELRRPITRTSKWPNPLKRAFSSQLPRTTIQIDTLIYTRTWSEIFRSTLRGSSGNSKNRMNSSRLSSSWILTSSTPCCRPWSGFLSLKTLTSGWSMIKTCQS